jgi:hypothetical protein
MIQISKRNGIGLETENTDQEAIGETDSMTDRIIGSWFEVHKEVGPGFRFDDKSCQVKRVVF